MGYRLTKMADVYSFGSLVLEVISGRSSARADWRGSGKLLLERAWQLYEEGRLLELVDNEVVDYPEEQVIRYMKVSIFLQPSNSQQKAVDEPSCRHAHEEYTSKREANYAPR